MVKLKSVHGMRALAKKRGQVAARFWSKTVPRVMLLRLAAHKFEYGATLDQLREQGMNVPIGADRDYSWGFYKQVKGKVHHALHVSAIASKQRHAHVELFERLHRTIEEIRDSMARTTMEEQFQAIGVLCREALITLGQFVYDRRRHPPLDSVEPSHTDAKRMLESFFAAEFGGASDKHARTIARTAVDMAVELQHRRTADHRAARLCVEATNAIVAIARIASDPGSNRCPIKRFS